MAASQNKKLDKEDFRTFGRLLQLARPYWLRLLIGTVCAAIGGGSLVAMLLAGQKLLAFVMDNRPTSEPSAIVAPAVAGGAAGAAVAAGAAAKNNAATVMLAIDAGENSESAALENVDVEPEADGKNESFVGRMTSSLLPTKSFSQLNGLGNGALFMLCGVLLLIIVVNSMAYFASMVLLQWVGQRMVMDLRIKLFAHLQELSVSFYTKASSGDMLSRAVADTQLLQQSVTGVITDAVRQPVMFLLVITYIICMEWELAIFSIVLLPIVVLPVVLIGRKLRRISREGQRRLADLTSVMKESLDGVAVVKAFGQEKREEARFSEQCRGFFRRMMSATKAKALSEPITHIGGGLGGIGAILYAMADDMPIEKCFLFGCAIWALYEPVKRLSRISMEIQQSSAAADRVFEIIDAPVTVSNAPDAVPITGALREIEFREIAFSYGEKQVFTNLNLKISAGESVAVVGPSGGGKTTLVSLLLRFFDPQSGAILRNGEDFRKFTTESIRANIGLVMQDTFLFNSTIADNIAYGKPDATREQIEAAARLAHAHEFVTQKELGYDTMVGERGSALSGGQKQRIAIARALLRNPSVLILDEATSALDTESERFVQQAIDELMGRMTIIVIAHRLSTIAKCDKIAVVADGGIAEYGTQTELLALNGSYSKLHVLQFGAAK